MNYWSKIKWQSSEYPISELARPLCFPADISVGSGSWTLDPIEEVVNCKMKLTNNKFAL